MESGKTFFWMAAVLLMLSGCADSPQVKEAKYLEKGRKEYRKKNYQVAILHFKNAMAARPMDAEPYYQLGLTHLAGGDIYTAASYFRKASDLNPKHTGAQLKLAELMSAALDKETLEEARKRALGVLKLLPGDVDALNALAAAELRLGDANNARAHLEEALRKSPGHLRSSVALAQIRLADKDAAGAEEALRQAAAHAPKAPEPRIYLAAFYASQGKAAEAEEQLRQALALDPQHGPALLALAELQLRTGRAAEAERTYQRAAALPGKQYKPVYALFLFQSGKREQAVAEFEKIAAADPEDRDIRSGLVKAYLALNRVRDAERVLTAALKKNGMDNDALLQRSRIYLGSGKYTEAQNDLNQVLHFRSNSAEAHYLLSKVSEGREDTAIRKQELGEVLRLDPRFLAARIELAQVLLAEGGAQSALQLLDEAPAGQKNAVALSMQRNWALLALGRVAEARQGIDRALAAKLPEALLQDAVLKLGQKDFAGARASAERTLAAVPDEVRALNVLFQTYRAQNQIAAGVRSVREYVLKRPASAQLQQYLGEVLFAGGDRAGARQALVAARSAQPGLILVELAMAQLDALEGKRDEARKTLTALLASHPGNIPGRLLLAQVEFTDGKSAAAIEHYRKVVNLDARNALALNGLAYLLAESNRADEALKYAQQAKEIAPENAAIDDTLGWTYYQKGMYPMAVTHLESALARDGSPTRKYHLAMAYLKAGDPKRGRQVLDAVLKTDPNLPEARAARELFGLQK